MKIIYNKHFPLSPFRAINAFGVVFARKNWGELSAYDTNHEAIHSAQMKELLFLPFYVIYLFEWLWGLLKYQNAIKAYLNISFEREAYQNEHNLAYLKQRRLWNSFKYIRRRTYNQ